VTGRDVVGLAERVIALLADPRGATTMGDKGLAWVDREWRWDLVSLRLAEILAKG
jgi:phosphatidylinositol alpha-1,6-mannosyltransferase